MDSPYLEALGGILSFSTFAQAERTLRRLEKLRRDYEAASDKKGVEYCRRIALLGRRRAELISQDMRVGLEKRLQKQEIATWFRIWLETPTVFDAWLSMRKETEEFKKLSAPELPDRSESGERNAGTETS